MAAAGLGASIVPVSAQWVTQSMDLVPGWNAVYLHVDASHATLESLVGADSANPIQEIWLWRPAPATAQFVTSPQTPTTANSQWVSWDRLLSATSPLQRLAGHAACLVRVTGPANYTWNLQGKAVPPHYRWTSTGLNFIGFPTPATAPPTFESFLAPAAGLQQAAEFYAYVGGELGASNPARIYAFRTRSLRRGEAYWMRAGSTYNRYFGPIEINLPEPTGLDFGADLGQSRFRLRNLTATPLTVTLALVHSETPPAGERPVTGPPPLLLRGALDAVTLTYAFTNLADGPQTLTLAPSGQPGSDGEVVIGLNRSLVTGAPGDLYAGLLRITDSLALSQIDVPVTAEVASRAGLWVGTATVDTVQQYLKSYQTNPDGTRSTTAAGAYLPTHTNTSPAAVIRPFPLRLIIHSDGVNGFLLQRVFQGLDASTNLVVATREQVLHPARLASARRISCTHLPWSAANPGWPLSAPLGSASTLTVTVPLAYDDQSSNPFLHTYHPDHSGLDLRTGDKLPRGLQSYEITRVLTLTFTAPSTDFASLTARSGALAGHYAETVTLLGQGSDARQFHSSGSFTLTRISSITTLTR